MSRAVVQQITLVDWVLTQQGVRLEPMLQAISDFLDNQHDMIEQVRRSEPGFEEPRDRSQWLDAAADPALAGSDADQELELSRVARAVPTATPCASSRTFIVSRCRDTMRSTAALIG